MSSIVDYFSETADLVHFKYNSLCWEFVYLKCSDWSVQVECFRAKFRGVPISYSVDMDFNLTVHVSMLSVCDFLFFSKGFCRSKDLKRACYRYEKL